MHTVFALLCFVVVLHWLIFPYPSGLLHWHCGNLTIAPVPAKQPWWIWINTSCEFIMNDCITTTKQSTVCIFLGIYCMLSVCCVMYALRIVCPFAQIQGPALICDKMFSLKISWNSTNTILIQRVALKIDRLWWNACQMPGRYITSKYKFWDLDIIMISCLKRYWNINTYVLELVKKPFCVEAYGDQNSHDLLGQKGDKHTCIVRYLRIYDYPGQWTIANDSIS